MRLVPLGRLAAAAAEVCRHRHHPAQQRPDYCAEGCEDCRSEAARIAAAWCGAAPALPTPLEVALLAEVGTAARRRCGGSVEAGECSGDELDPCAGCPLELLELLERSLRTVTRAAAAAAEAPPVTPGAPPHEPSRTDDTAAPVAGNVTPCPAR